MEVDPFEARLDFLGLLGKLNASQYSIQKVGSFAMRNKNLHEDLYSCIIEELEQTPSINSRMNIFYVLDSICHQSHKAGFTGYIDLIQKNLSRIIECVTPAGAKGNVNVAGTKKILDSWRAKRIFAESVVNKAEAPLLSRDLGASAPATTDSGFTKDDILKRMDEDRERHKRIREEIWIRPPDEDSDAEFTQNWDEVSDMEDNDYEDMEGENEKYLPKYPWNLEFDRFLPSPAIFKSKSTSVATATSELLDSGAAAAKRLTSPEGTVSMSSTSGLPPNVFQPHPSREPFQAHTHPHSNIQHSRSPPPPPPPPPVPPPAPLQLNHRVGGTHSVNSSSNYSRRVSHSYHDSSIPTAPAAETLSTGHRLSPSSRRTSPPSRYYSYYERASGHGNTGNTGPSNVQSEHAP